MEAPDALTKEALIRMEQDWDARAREAPEYYVATANRNWRMDEFFKSGEMNVDNDVLADSDTTCGAKEFARMKILEIGCGAGRMTRALAALFGEVHAVDISAEMIYNAKRNLSDLRNVFLYKNNGVDLANIPDRSFDFAFSFIVFQHIPSPVVIESYVREVYRCLRPGAFFKFQVQGDSGIRVEPGDTWVGLPMSLADAGALAERCGFEFVQGSGEGTQYFWLWFLKPRFPRIPRVIRTRASAIWTHLSRSVEKRVSFIFSTSTVRAGEGYVVRVAGFSEQVIDIGYELSKGPGAVPVTGVVSRWCFLDSIGEATIPVPIEHPTGAVRITKVRSRTGRGRWYRADGTIQVEGVDDLRDR